MLCKDKVALRMLPYGSVSFVLDALQKTSRSPVDYKHSEKAPAATCSFVRAASCPCLALSLASAASRLVSILCSCSLVSGVTGVGGEAALKVDVAVIADIVGVANTTGVAGSEEERGSEGRQIWDGGRLSRMPP